MTSQTASNVILTPYGDCDKAALSSLRDQFDTAVLLHDVDTLAALGAALSDPDGLRAEWLRLHAMAHTVLNGAAMTALRRSETLIDLADDIEMQLAEIESTLSVLRSRISQFVGLRPVGL